MSEADMTRHLSQHAAGYFKNLQLYPPMTTDELQTEEVDELLEILDSTLAEVGDKDSRSIGMQLTLDTHVEIGIQVSDCIGRPSSRYGRTRTTTTLQATTTWSILSSVTGTKTFISLPNSSWPRTWRCEVSPSQHTIKSHMSRKFNINRAKFQLGDWFALLQAQVLGSCRPGSKQLR